MPRHEGLRERKKAQTRERLADVAAALFAEHGYEQVSMSDVARAADVSDQTVYNYFPAKQDLVLDRVDEFVELYRSSVLGREPGSSPARALAALVEADIERYRHADPRLARGEFPAQCIESPTLHRFALEFRERQIHAVADAIVATCAGIDALVARAHAAALVCVAQNVLDRIGVGILAGGPTPAHAAELQEAAAAAFADLDRAFHTTHDAISSHTHQEVSRD